VGDETTKVGDETTKASAANSSIATMPVMDAGTVVVRGDRMSSVMALPLARIATTDTGGRTITEASATVAGATSTGESPMIAMSGAGTIIVRSTAGFDDRNRLSPQPTLLQRALSPQPALP